MTTSQSIYHITSMIPKGKVSTYSSIAKLADIKNPRVVGNILHKNKDINRIPCYRVIKNNGKIADGFGNGKPEEQIKLLRDEAIDVKNGKVDLAKYLWQPNVITKKLVKLPERKPTSQKGDNGRVLIIGGSSEYVGAPALAGIAALRSGADSVIIAAPEKVSWAINCLSPDLVTYKLKGKYLTSGHYVKLKDLIEKADCILMGAGVTERKDSLNLFRMTIKKHQGFKVLDAAGLLCFRRKDLTNAILLPNPNEYQRLMARFPDNIRSLLKRDNIIVAKSHQTIILSEQGDFINKTGNPGLTKAGTGDVLAGLIAGFLAQSKNPLQSVINAVYFIGKVADVLFKQKRGYFYLASDLAKEMEIIDKKISLA